MNKKKEIIKIEADGLTDEERREKCLAFIKDNATSPPKTERKASSTFAFPIEIAQEIYDQIQTHDGSIALSVAGFNKQFGWKEDSVRRGYIAGKLEKTLPVDGKTWKVGAKNKKLIYVFSLIDKKETDEDAPIED